MIEIDIDTLVNGGGARVSIRPLQVRYTQLMSLSGLVSSHALTHPSGPLGTRRTFGVAFAR